MLASSHGYFGRNLSPRKIVPNVEVETTNMPSSPVHTKSYVFRPQQIWPPALFTNIYTKYSKCLQAITNMSSSPEDTRYCVCRPQQIYPPAQYIQGIVFEVHNKYVYWAGGHICCGLSHNTLYLLGWRTYLLWPADTRLCIKGLEDIFVLAVATIPCTYWAGGHICCGLQTQNIVLQGWRTYLLWP